MKFDAPLLRGKLVQRYKRFLVDVALDTGETVTAHTPNPGSMLTCLEPGEAAWISRSDNPKRKLAYTWELATSAGALVGVNTLLANRLAAEAITSGTIPELGGYGSLRREVRYGENSRVDILLEDGTPLEGGVPMEDRGRPPHYVEIKNVSMGRAGVAGFPDSVSVRGAKHMRELAAQVRKGHAATVLFVVQREDCEAFRPADDIDPTYGKALRDAAASGVQVLAWRASVSPQEIRLAQALPVEL